VLAIFVLANASAPYFLYQSAPIPDDYPILARYSNDGVQMWAKQLDLRRYAIDLGTSVDGSIYVSLYDSGYVRGVDGVSTYHPEMVENFLVRYEEVSTITTPSSDGIMFSSTANEGFSGDSGTNTVIFSSALTNYTLTETDTGWLISSTTDGNDTISNVERLQFTDLNLALDTDAANSAGGIYRLYKAALDRTPDLGGLGYWIAQADAGKKDAVGMATDFTYADEFKTLFGVSTADNYMTGEDITALVTKIYENVLDRAPDAGGRDYYAGQITTKSKTVGQVLAEISDSTENKLAVADLIGTGIAYTPWVG
jgi:hypothetical protein